jgi:ABC-type glycerol-3-phosphate transport system substrate-binding protein
LDFEQLIDLTPLVKADFTDEIRADFYDFQLEVGFLPGTQFRYQLPKHVSVLMIEYNRDAFDEAGVDYPSKDWDRDDYAEALMALTKKGADGSVEQFGGFIPAWSWDRLWPHLVSFGGHFADPDDRTKCLLGTKATQEALEWVRARMWDDNSLAQPLQIEGQSGHDVFASATCASAEAITTHLERIVRDTEFPWDVGWLPRDPAKRGGYGGSDGWGVYKGVEKRANLDAAWEFLMFLTGPVYQELLLIPTNRTPIPARRSLFDRFMQINRDRDPELEDVNLEGLLDMMVEEDYLKADPDTFKIQAAAQEIVNPALEQVFVTGTAPVSVVGDTCSEVEAVQAG